MLSPPLQKLLSIASDPLCSHAPQLLPPSDAFGVGLPVVEQLAPELVALLWAKNGFYAFEHALHVFPSCATDSGRTLWEWNEPSLWKSAFGSVLDGCLCFAENIFGEQFCLREGHVYHFDPEQAKLALVGADLDEWAQRILDNYNIETGWEVAHNWQMTRGARCQLGSG